MIVQHPGALGSHALGIIKKHIMPVVWTWASNGAQAKMPTYHQAPDTLINR